MSNPGQAPAPSDGWNKSHELATQYAIAGLRTLTLVHGGAVVAILSFAGNAGLDRVKPALIANSLSYFTWGLVAALGAMLTSYTAQSNATHNRRRTSYAFEALGFVLVLISLGLFVVGAMTAQRGFNTASAPPPKAAAQANGSAVAVLPAQAVGEASNSLYSEITAAWVQAVGSIAAIAVAVALPRFDKARERRKYGAAAHAAAMLAHQNLAAVWVTVGGAKLMGQPEPVKSGVRELLDGLERAAGECDGFPLVNAESVRAVMHLRALAQCCRGMAGLLREAPVPPEAELFLRAHRITNYAYHLLILVARDADLPEPPEPHETQREGVPPDILEQVDRRA